MSADSATHLKAWAIYHLTDIPEQDVQSVTGVTDVKPYVLVGEIAQACEDWQEGEFIKSGWLTQWNIEQGLVSGITGEFQLIGPSAAPSAISEVSTKALLEIIGMRSAQTSPPQ
ncbi:hypothetical protein ACFSJ3_14545 [Corallincola platygyrae]|uniref:Uncharacterized protein n=1 Tax=Corallincola platygyrae TaxID=1193278 RepID=A0ABW4XPK0_9GAMM